MARIVSVNHYILNPKEFNGKRVVTFSDIDLLHGRAEGTARYRFRDNKKHFVEGTDYFLVNPQTLENAKLGEIRPIGIDSVSVRGTTFITETGYLMLVKSFTDDLAWTVQRELVNNYFRTKEEKAIQENSNRRKVVDIPQNKKFQNGFQKIRKKMAAMEVMLDCVNKFSDATETDAYLKAIREIGDQIG
ncbi:ORF6N domain-containing protein [Anaerotignum lactatifermentans]|uniref:ORF6N domain-containing protein n=1 Tax=Anaerotignum lactatifermentans TaxID=160404 RepID=UPI00255D0BC2|nr:ORF6N domain-containing protein [Anaerotignum lactatifermentans]